MSRELYEPVIGLEVHVQLLTETKMFCRCPNRFGEPQNTLVCPTCLGYPGTLPVPNHRAIDLAITLAHALGCEVHAESVFARKNYFYPDLPKGYQISQFDRPLAENGQLQLTQHDGVIGIERLHLEEDAGKLLHEAPGGASLPGESLVDFNRCGVPLVEIVSRPEMRTAAEASDYLQTLHQLLLYTRTSSGNMEEGSLRCDANVSVRPRGTEKFGTKAEVKNINSFRNVARAIEYEIDRQIAILEGGGRVVQETRNFDADSGSTVLLRSKEQAHDYRYFPEPDLRPLVLASERVDELRSALPELPAVRRTRFVSGYDLPAGDARVLTQTRELADYYEQVVSAQPHLSKPAANWVMTEVLRELKARRQDADSAMPPARLGALLALIAAGEISNTAAKEVFAACWESGEEPAAEMARLGLGQVGDETEIERWIDDTIRENAGPVTQYRSGKTQTFGFLVGQVMKRSGGRAEPKTVQRMLRTALEGQAGSDAPAA
jgi:aspartyl-tRNA(Asn)/glutamyl-tRNA(Gln) amidotransferase subunit B